MQIRFLVVVVFSLFLKALVMAQGPPSPAAGILVSKYVSALQKRDFKTVISLTSAYQADVARIKAQNPQVLWPKLLDQYYSSKASVFSEPAGYWQNYFEALMGPGGDPAQGIRAGAAMLPPSAKWSVTETRHQRVQNTWNGREYDQGTVYVTVNYPVWQDAPRLGNKLLNETILQFTVDLGTQLVLGTGRTAAADTFKQDPLRITRVELGENYAGMSLTYGVVGGIPPFTCRIRFGSLQAQQDCSALARANFTSSFEWSKLHEAFPLSASVSVQDGKGRSDEVALTLPAFPPVQLNIYPLWTYCWIRDPWFQRGEGEAQEFQYCKKPVSQLGVASTAAVQPAIDPNSAGSSVPPSDRGQPSAPTPVIAAAPGAASPCGDFDACLRAGKEAMRTSNWAGALSNLQAASAQRADNGVPWALMGTTYLAMDHMPDALAAWDKALGLGSPIVFAVCHERTLQPCERGFFVLGTKSVAFGVNSQKVFSVQPAQAIAKGTLNNSLTGHVSFGVQVENKNYNLDFFPIGVACQTQLLVKCPAQGLAQQLAVANYISRTLPKLASSTLTGTQVTTPTVPAPEIERTSATTCAGAVDRGYAIQLQGHLYKVSGIGPTGPEQMPVFFDEKDTQVTDAGLLQSLAEAVWTRENIVVDQMSRNGAKRVQTILDTSQALAQYSTVQDVLARVMVEAVEAGFSGGTSLSKAVPNLTVGVVKQQLLNAPKIVLNRAAQQGMQASINQYKQMEKVPLPSADARVLKAEDLVAIRGFYTHAQALELSYDPLAVSFMPKNANDLAEQALRSAFSELMAGPVFAGSPDSDLVTLKKLWALQTEVGNLSKGLPALKAFSQSVSFTTATTEANQRMIANWAKGSATACSSSSASAAPVGGNFGSFYAQLRMVINHRDQTALRELMTIKFEWALDGYITRDQALNNIGQIIGWQKFWESAMLAVTKPAQACKPHYCNNRVGYETFTKTPFPLEMMFELGPDNQWRWSAVLGD